MTILAVKTAFLLGLLPLAAAFTITSKPTTTTSACSDSVRKIANYQRTYFSSRRSTLLRDKWDDLDDEDDDEFAGFGYRGPPIPKDMRYIGFNVERQNKNFAAIRAAGGEELTNDIYIRDPFKPSIFWFVGKIARISDVSIEKAVARQYGLIEEHAARLRPAELYPKNGELDIYSAPGDSEMDVAYNRAHIKFIKMEREDAVEGAMEVKNVMVGFQGELYDNGEEGFRSERTEEGLPLNPEIQDGGAE
eukprot:999294_1